MPSRLGQEPFAWVGPTVLRRPHDQPGTPPFSGCYFARVIFDHPLGYWRLDEPNGTAAADEMSPNSGFIGGGVTLGVAGLLTADANTAFTFNGSSGNVDVSYTTWPAGAGTRSTEAWVKTTSATTQAVVHYGTAGVGQWWGMRVNSNGQMGLSLFGTDLAFGSAGALSDGLRHHIVATYDGTNVRAYIDGVEASGSPSAQTPATLAANAWVGTDGSNYFNGTIDEPAIYNYALPAAVIAEHFRLGLYGCYDPSAGEFGANYDETDDWAES